MTGNESGRGDQSETSPTQPATTRESNISLQYPLLTKTNYSAWAIKMEIYMEAQGVWEAIENEEPVETRKDMMALAVIYQGISEDILLQLGAKKTAKDAWNSLKTMHLGAARVKKVRAQGLRWDLESLRMKENETVDEYTGKIQVIVSQLRSLGEEVDEAYVVKKILRSVSGKFLQIASTIEEFGDLKNKSIEEITSSLKAHEERLKGRETDREDQVLLTRSEWKKQESSRSNTEPQRQFSQRQFEPQRQYETQRGNWRGRRGPTGIFRSNGNHGRGQTYDRSRLNLSKIRCFTCSECGHFASDATTEVRKKMKCI